MNTAITTTLLALTLAVAALAQPLPVQAAGHPALVATVRGYPQARFHGGDTLRVTVTGLAAGRAALCVGLASPLDPGGLALNLGRLHRLGGSPALSVATVTIPTGLIPAEPAGVFFLFAGACAGQTVDTPFVAREAIEIS